MQLYAYELKERKGLILEEEGRFAEIAPLPNYSKESLAEAQLDLYGERKLPSVRFALSCLKSPLESIDLPMAYLKKKPGASTLKLKLGSLSLDDAISYVKELLPHYTLRLDFNRKWQIEKALEFTKHFQREDFEYLEEPTEDLAAFANLCDFPLAVDESQTYDLPSLAFVVVKPTILGGVSKVKKGVRLVFSSAYESGIGLLHIARLGKNHHLPIGLDTVFENDLLTSPIETSEGRFRWRLSESPVNFSKLTLLDRLP